jgi:hypothetical protein
MPDSIAARPPRLYLPDRDWTSSRRDAADVQEPAALNPRQKNVEGAVTAALAVALVGICLGACAGHDNGCQGPGNTADSCSGRPGSGIVQGTLDRVGGPAPGSPTPVPGLVTLTGASRSYQVAADANGSFSVRVAPGRYTVTATSPRVGISCRATHRVQVPARGVATVHVWCEIP